MGDLTGRLQEVEKKRELARRQALRNWAKAVMETASDAGFF